MISKTYRHLTGTTSAPFYEKSAPVTPTQSAAVSAHAKHGALDASDSAEISQTVVSLVEQDDAAPEQDVANVEHDTCDSNHNLLSVTTDCNSEAIVFNVVRQTYTSSNERRWANMVDEDDADFDFFAFVRSLAIS